MPMSGAPPTFLFADLVGFTVLAAQEGDHRAADVAHELYDRVRPLLGTYGADEVKTLGDGLMLRAAQPAQAIYLGLGVVDAVERLPGLPAVRVGMHTGPAVERDGDWYGTTVNVAARLCAAAGPGEVLISEATYAAAGRLRKVDCDEQRLHWLKNLHEPVPARVAVARDCRVDLRPALRARLAAAAIPVPRRLAS